MVRVRVRVRIRIRVRVRDRVRVGIRGAVPRRRPWWVAAARPR